MPRKVTDGPIRNKERTRQRVIDALGNIVIKDGFSNLNISKIAEQAQVDRKVIYDYFGGLDGVIKEYLDTKDYWKVVADNMPSIRSIAKPITANPQPI
ncbi:TetR/AcrR family transcriptional regulator [Chitinophaga sedimenti]|uniref:TetR/AcrR family transcriptional regulator n=1 Tax=Chitinophaga sedimenti TaxID=2033606 RepID=UPI00200595DD|nr:TetR/AcrR family transcriptional regulator [Chitinophaga sedimenti]MCK7555927.1 TetR/AcrR family transcriptional regulator [Chitinophaga sedimenti]